MQSRLSGPEMVQEPYHDNQWIFSQCAGRRVGGHGEHDKRDAEEQWVAFYLAAEVFEATLDGRHYRLREDGLETGR